MSKEERLNEIQKEIIKVNIIDAPACILVGLGLYGKFGANGDAFHPLLNDASTTTWMLILGGAVCVWSAFKIFSLAKEKRAIESQ